MQERRGGKPRRFFFFRCSDLSEAPEADAPKQHACGRGRDRTAGEIQGLDPDVGKVGRRRRRGGSHDRVKMAADPVDPRSGLI